MSALPAAIGLLGLATVGFVVSIRLGMLLGRGLDRAIESRRESESAADIDTENEPTPSGGHSGE